MSDSDFKLLKREDTPFEILEWVTLKYRSQIKYKGALIAPFTSKVYVRSSDNNTFFWDECYNCPALFQHQCPGGVNVSCYRGLNPRNSKYKKIKELVITHPPILTFSSSFGNRRYNYFALKTTGKQEKTLTESFLYNSYVRSNTYSSSAVCLGSLGGSKNFDNVQRLQDLFMFEWIGQEINEDLYYYGGENWEDWVLNFNDYSASLAEYSGIDYGLNTLRNMAIYDQDPLSDVYDIEIFSAAEYPNLYMNKNSLFKLGK